MKMHKGRYIVKNPEKYAGDVNKVVYRSGWERSAFIWIDNNPDIEKWVSEELAIPYKSVDGEIHRYFPDLLIKYKDGKVYLIEIKPKKECKKPVTKNRPKKRVFEESLTYAKNASKWKAAEAYCQRRNWSFQIWHEDIMKGLGIKII